MDLFLSGNDDSSELDKLAEMSLDTVGKNIAPRSVGHPENVPDSWLQSNRGQLLSLLEATWDEVGWTIGTIQNLSEVPKALRAWEPHRDNYLVQLLLRPTAARIPIKASRSKNREWNKLGESIRTASDERFRCQESVRKANEALAMASELERDRISKILAERNQALSRAETTLASTTRKRKELKETLDDGFAHFARAEVLDFCTSKRYTLKPFSTANAFAGLPYIGWRQSMKRCSVWKLKDLGTGHYMVVETISQIVNSCNRRSKLVDCAEQLLRDRLTKKSSVIVDLGNNWYFLNESIKSALLEKGISSKELPFRIAQIYYRMKLHPSPADLLFAEEMRIVL
jgi:hypothetical protein